EVQTPTMSTFLLRTTHPHSAICGLPLVPALRNRAESWGSGGNSHRKSVSGLSRCALRVSFGSKWGVRGVTGGGQMGLRFVVGAGGGVPTAEAIRLSPIQT